MITTDTHVYFYTNEFSNWHRCSVIDTRRDIEHPTTEHAFMFLKAEFFRDNDAMKGIILADHPREAKEIGRKVKGYNEEEWNAVRYGYMVLANLWKFGQNPSYLDLLKATDNRILVEASHYDKVWGVGLAENDPAILDEKNWTGQNLLGKALGKVRNRLC